MIVKGHYTTGGGKAHLSNAVHEPVFGCPMFGTFNVRTAKDIKKFMPTLMNPKTGCQYYHVRIDGQHDAWAWRRKKSFMTGTKWELVSKELLPDNLKHKTITMEIT